MDSALEAIKLVRLPDIRILALLNHAVYLILQLPLPYRLSRKTETEAGAGGMMHVR